MIPIIKKRQRITLTSYSREYEYRKEPGRGFSFTCDSAGIVLLESQAARDNYADCKAGKLDVKYLGIKKHESSYYEPAIGKCSCGHEVTLSAFTNTCSSCGRDYNAAGQELGPRQFWGEETGESPAEILALGHDIS